jgi:hypothetical protein
MWVIRGAEASGRAHPVPARDEYQAAHKQGQRPVRLLGRLHHQLAVSGAASGAGGAALRGQLREPGVRFRGGLSLSPAELPETPDERMPGTHAGGGGGCSRAGIRQAKVVSVSVVEGRSQSARESQRKRENAVGSNCFDRFSLCSRSKHTHGGLVDTAGTGSQ